MPQPRESDTKEEDDRDVADRDRRPDRDDDEYAEPERVSNDGKPAKEIEEQELDEGDIIDEEDDDFDRRDGEGPDA